MIPPGRRPTVEVPPLLRATLADLPTAVAEAIGRQSPLPEGGRRFVVDTGEVVFSALEWGPPDGRPLLLIHGVTSSARTFWRVGPALAALGWRSIAPDLPGHGRTESGRTGGDRRRRSGPFQAGFRFAETARSLVTFARLAFDDPSAAGPTAPDARLARLPPARDAAPQDLSPRGLAVIGHSWGAMLAASLPAAGLRPNRIVLLDPPVLDRRALLALGAAPSSRHDPTFDTALATVRSENPDWEDGDQIVKAEALTQLWEPAALAVLLDNGNWDAGLGALAEPPAAGISIWVVRGEVATGSLTPDAWLPRIADRIGGNHILTVAGGPHSPQRTHLAPTVQALLQALAD